MFMEPQVEHGWFTVVETRDGETHYVPADYYNPADFEDVETVEDIEGFGARLSAPGYLDCTEWSVYETAKEAIAELDRMYGDDSDEWEGAMRDLRETFD